MLVIVQSKCIQHHRKHRTCSMMLLFHVLLFFSAIVQKSFGQPGFHSLSSLRSHLGSVSNKHISAGFQQQLYSKPAAETTQIPQYMLELYKKLVKNPRNLPFGADFVRSFTSTGHRMVGEMSVVTFTIKIPSSEQVTNVMLQLCLSKDGADRQGYSALIRISDLTTKRWEARAKVRANGCSEIPLEKFPKRAILRNKKSAKFLLGVRIYQYNSWTIEQETEKAKSNLQLVLIVFTRSKSRNSADISGNLTPQINRKRSSENGCRKKSLFVNFAGLGYRDIIVPTIFDAKQCVGVCNYPLGKMTNPAQHSMIQQLLFSLYGSRIAKPTCCAPRKFAPLTVMINDTFSKGIVIRSLEDMVVEECGCI